MQIDYTLYLVTNRDVIRDATLPDAVERAIRGGCTMVQIRERDAPSTDFLRRALEVKRVTDRYGVPLIVNNRADIALASDAAGVHVGQSDLPAAAARRLMGSKRILGVSVTTVEEAVRAEADGADYLGVGAIFPSSTKPDAKAVGLQTLQSICGAVRLPVVAIGGIREDTVPLLPAGLAGVAVVSAILAQTDVRAAAERMRLCLERAGGRRGR